MIANSIFVIHVAILCLLAVKDASAWGGGDDEADVSAFGNSLSRDWLYGSTSLSLKLEGCIWGYVSDNEDSGCMEDSSEDGTTYWYQMANCRRAQAVYSVYGSGSSSAGCNSGNFKETVSNNTGRIIVLIAFYKCIIRSYKQFLTSLVRFP